MSDPTNDTHPAIRKMLIEGYRAMSPAQKLAIVNGLTQMVIKLAMSDVRRRHPEADEREVRLRVASRWLGPDTMLNVFGWDVREKGY